MSAGLILAISLIVFVVLGVPLAFSLAGATALALFFTGQNLITVAQRMFQGINSFPYLCLPFFILAGNLMASGGISRRLVRFFEVLLGRATGSLAIVAILASMFFAAISGSSAATCAAIGTAIGIQMIDKGYERNFTGATISCASCTGIIIPPSVPMVLYCLTAGTSISSMFKAGIVPGLLFGATLIVVAVIVCIKRGYGKGNKYSVKEKLRAFWEAIPALLMPAIILGGIYGGIFTATESACVAVIYGFVVAVFVYKEMDIKEAYNTIVNTSVGAGNLLVVVAGAMVFGMLLTMERIPNEIAAAFISVVDSKLVFWIACNIIFLIMGCLMECGASIMIMTPMLLPVAQSLGISEIQFGVVMIANLSIGMVTPPFGLSLFVIIDIVKAKLLSIVKASWPYLLATVIVLILLSALPALSFIFIK